MPSAKPRHGHNHTQTLPPSRNDFTTSTPATGANAAEHPPHDFVYVRLEQAMLGQSCCPCRSVTSPVKLIVTWPQYELGTSTASLCMLLLPGYCISLAVAPAGPVTVKSVVFSEATGSENVTRNVAVVAVVLGLPLGYDIWVA